MRPSVGSKPILDRNAKPFGYPIDVVEVGDHLYGAGDGRVVETVAPQDGDVITANGSRGLRQPLGVLEQRLRALVESCSPPILCKPVHQFLVVDLGPEVVEMRCDSVMTVVVA